MYIWLDVSAKQPICYFSSIYDNLIRTPADLLKNSAI